MQAKQLRSCTGQINVGVQANQIVGKNFIRVIILKGPISRSKPAPLQLGSKGHFTLGTIQLHNLQLAAIIVSSQVISLILRRPRSLFVVPSANNLGRLRIRLPSDIRKEGIELK